MVRLLNGAMGRSPRYALCTFLCAVGVGGLSHPQRPVNIADRTDEALLTPPGLVVALRHNLHHEKAQGRYVVMFSAPEDAPVERMYGGDSGAPSQRGYEWWSIKPNSNWKNRNQVHLPPGLVFTLRHSQIQRSWGSKVWRTPVRRHFGILLEGPAQLMETPSGSLSRQFGGDLGAEEKEGFYWEESTGNAFSNWRLIDRLPKWTVVGLKHSRNQREKRLQWNGAVYDPADPDGTPPEGFRRVFGGDHGGSRGEGFYWYEKITGPELIRKPRLETVLERSLFTTQSDQISLDRDQDGLVDDLENRLASTFRPYLIFDDAEGSRLSHEPVTLFQVTSLVQGEYGLRKSWVWKPIPGPKIATHLLGIRWVFLFQQDSGYGSRSDWHCVNRNSHQGDNDDALFVLGSSDDGNSWRLVFVGLSSRGADRVQGYPVFPSKHPIWPFRSRLEVYDLTHTVIYLSAGKHHQHLTRDLDGRDSPYGGVPILDDCDDDLNALGDRFLVDITSLNSPSYNNVGEHEKPLSDDLSKFYPAKSAWGKQPFYEVGPISAKWLK